MKLSSIQERKEWLDGILKRFEVNTIISRKEMLLEGIELTLKIPREKKTNLRIILWRDGITLRVDKQNSFDYYLDEVKFMENEQPTLELIVNRYGLTGAKLKDIDEVLEITKDMEFTEPNYW